MIKQFQVSSDIQSTGQLRWFGKISIVLLKKQSTIYKCSMWKNIAKCTNSIHENVTGEM